MKTNYILSILFVIATFILSSCDEHIPPAIEFKTGGDYTSTDVTVSKGASLLVGIVADKKEDDMKIYNISYAYDGATTTTTKETFSLTAAEEKHYEKDYEFVVRSVAGTEVWSFVITDKDGNIAKLSINVTVE